MKLSDFEKMKFIAEIRFTSSERVIRKYYDPNTTLSFEVERSERRYRELPYGNWMTLEEESSR